MGQNWLVRWRDRERENDLYYLILVYSTCIEALNIKIIKHKQIS